MDRQSAVARLRAAANRMGPGPINTATVGAWGSPAADSLARCCAVAARLWPTTTDHGTQSSPARLATVAKQLAYKRFRWDIETRGVLVQVGAAGREARAPASAWRAPDGPVLLAAHAR